MFTGFIPGVTLKLCDTSIETKSFLGTQLFNIFIYSPTLKFANVSTQYWCK